jgi:hypothetical protein
MNNSRRINSPKILNHRLSVRAACTTSSSRASTKPSRHMVGASVMGEEE